VVLEVLPQVVVAVVVLKILKTWIKYVRDPPVIFGGGGGGGAIIKLILI
jgi:hypothetical protein